MISTGKLVIDTKGDTQVIDITEGVNRELAAARLHAGTVTIFVTGSTAGVTVIEYEKGLLQDFRKMWERTVPADINYQHNQADDNGHSHIRASLLGPSLVVPFNNGRLTLGRWQRIVLVDFDSHPRSREVILQIMGE